MRLSIETNNPHEAETARKMAEAIAIKYGFLDEPEINKRAAHGLQRKPARPIPRQPPAKTPRGLIWKESELLRSAYIFFTGETPTPRQFEKALSSVAAKVADFLETVRER